jgi:RimJ/RimL family protein N-acetyltransferase
MLARFGARAVRERAPMILLDQSNAEIRTDRLVLRAIRADDAAPLSELFNNWAVMRFLSSPPWPYVPDDAQQFVAMRMPPEKTDSITRAITLNDAFIGCIDVIMKPASSAQREAGYNLGYWIGEPYWAQGYMSEAARAFIAHAFATLPIETIYSGAFTDNAASLRIQDKLGFVRDRESMLFSTPNKMDMAHTNTHLARFVSPRV